MVEVTILGIFEDRGHQDFQEGLVKNISSDVGVKILIVPRLTRGCHFPRLTEYLQFAESFNGVIVAVDAKRMDRDRKIHRLKQGVTSEKMNSVKTPVLWCIAQPCIEEWLMADALALPLFLQKNLGLRRVPSAPRPSRAKTERTAKERLRDWIINLSGVRPLRGGVEYAKAVGYTLVPSRIGPQRNPDLKKYIEQLLPAFMQTIAV